MQFDPDVRHIHTLIFETEAAARDAHPKVVDLVGEQFSGWTVQEGGQRAFVVLDQPPPTATWQYLFATRGPLSNQQMHRIHQAIRADEAQWNQI